MRPGEYILTLLAVISGLAASHLATTLHRLLAAGRRVRWDWLGSTAAVFVAYQLVLSWWTSWLNLKDQGQGTTELWAFLIRLGQLLCVFLCARAVLPEDVPAEGVDLRAHYLGVSRYLWRAQVVLLLLLAVAVPVHVYFEGRPPPLGGAWAALVAQGAAAAVLAATRRPAVHAVVVPLYLAALIASTLRVAI